MNKLKFMLMFIVCFFFLAACWDQIEIEERAFVFGMAVDSGEQSSEVKLTQQVVVPENMSPQVSGGGYGKAYRNLSDTGMTLYEVGHEISKQASRTLDSTHLGVVLFSEDIMKQPKLFEKYFDIFFREKRMRRGIKLAVTSGQAEELLFVEAEHEKIPSEYIKNLLESKMRLDITDLVRVGDIGKKMYENTSFPLPFLEKKSSTVIDYAGLAIYNSSRKRMTGILKGDDAKGLSYIRGLKNNGSINAEVDGEPVTIEIIKIKRKFSLKNQDPNQLKFAVQIQIEAIVTEQSGWENLKKFEVRKKFEQATEERVKKMVKNTLHILQNDLQTDAAGLGEYLSRYHPKLWKEVKDGWEQEENYFSKSDIDCSVKVIVKEPGSINQSTKE